MLSPTMNEQSPQPPDERTPQDVKLGWADRRRERIYQEIQRNRRGEYTVPTWVLTVTLVAIIAAFVVLFMVT
jgi:hypothetical protein